MLAILRRAGARLFEAIVVLWIVITATFFLARSVPGGPFDLEREMTPEARQNLTKQYGLDKPLASQYLLYLNHIVHGNLGASTKYPGWSVQELLEQKVPVSAELGAWALLVTITIGLTAGVLAAARPRSWSDYTTMTFAMVGVCLPTFVLGPILNLIFGVKLEWVNVNGWHFPQDRILPCLVLGLYYAAYLARLTRASLLEVRSLDFVRTARAKGCSPSRTLLVHALRNALGPVVAYLGPVMAGLITGSFVIEKIFQIPGIGRAYIESALDKDYDMFLALTILYTSLLLVCNWLSDVILVALNPKVRIE